MKPYLLLIWYSSGAIAAAALLPIVMLLGLIVGAAGNVVVELFWLPFGQPRKAPLMAKGVK